MRFVDQPQNHSAWDAAEAAFKLINERVKAIVKERTAASATAQLRAADSARSTAGLDSAIDGFLVAGKLF